MKHFLISIVLLLACLSFSSLEANFPEDRYWGTIIRNPPANYVLRMDDGKILNAEWESGYDRWSIGERIILTTENGSGIMLFNKRRTRVAVFPIIPRTLDSREVGVFALTGIGYCILGEEAGRASRRRVSEV